MKKLNNKGMTMIEILIAFIILTIISVRIFALVIDMSDRKKVADNKEKFYTYKNLLTKEINDDIIKGGLIKVEIIGLYENILKTNPGCITYQANTSNPCASTTYLDSNKYHFKANKAKAIKIIFTLKDGSSRELKIVMQKKSRSKTALSSTNNYSDKYYISYGNPKLPNTVTEYPLPNLGQTKKDGNILYDLEIEGVTACIGTKQCNETFSLPATTNNIDNIFNLVIQFKHPDFGTKYFLRINSIVNMDSFDQK